MSVNKLHWSLDTLLLAFKKDFLYKIALLGQATLDLHFMQEESDRENEFTSYKRESTST